jgi:hypothetical protein
LKRLAKSVVQLLIALSFGVALSISQPASAADRWTVLARKVGQSEEQRASAIRELKRMPNLSASLRKALYTSERPLALEVISALELRGMMPELIELVPTDRDGFVTLALNSMMTDKNQSFILDTYIDLLDPKYQSSLSASAIMAMLEPLGRVGIKLSRPTLTALKKNPSPEIRGSLLYYIRIMALRNRVFENLDLVTEMTKAEEFQLRLQAISVSAEILSEVKSPTVHQALKSREDLNGLCSQESDSKIKDVCLSFLTVNVAAKK